LYLQPKAAPRFSPTLVRGGFLQQKCACGGTLGSTRECEECRKKRLRRSAANEAAPPIVHDALRSPGQPLDPAARSCMEQRFGHDFSQVRVHTDARAAESARLVNALAYTVGRDVVFGAGLYAPATESGRTLLSHELAHVVQQRGTAFQPGSALHVGAPDDMFERQAEAAAHSSDATADVTSGRTGPFIQRAALESEAASSGGATATKDECAGWFADRESTTKRAAERYVRTELAGDRGMVERIECDLFVPDTGAYACTAHFTDGTPIRVIVRRDVIIVGVPPLQTFYPPPDRPLCWYDYECPGPTHDLVLKKRKCQTSKPGKSD
jgi:hypothetical protein